MIYPGAPSLGVRSSEPASLPLKNHDVLRIVMDRVWNSRGRAGSGFGQSGSGSGPVFANFESRVRVLHCRVSGFRRVYHLCKKGAIF